MPFETVRLSVDRRIATVTLDNPSHGNAIDGRMAFDLREVCQQLRQDDEIWVVVLTGAGEAFCMGTDLSIPLEEAFRTLRVAEDVASIEKPVIAAMNGDAVDQGLELALACDLRIASDGASFGLTQVRRGLIPWDGGTQRLPRLVGRSRAVELVLTSRVMDAQEALDIGLVNGLAEAGQVLPGAMEMAEAIASHGPIAARYLKEAVMKGADMTLEQGLRLEADLNFILQTTTDRAEGICSFLERRAPEYRGE